MIDCLYSVWLNRDRCSRGVRLANNDFCSVFSLVLQNCGFRFGFTKLTAVSVFRFG